jgi:hypothetical protein
MTRETRMLLIIITLSVAVLMLLARFRFPEETRVDRATASAPLERLAARATYDELAGIIAELSRRIAPSVVVLRVEDDGHQRFVPAVRVRPDLALAHVSGDSRILAAVGQAGTVEVAAFDPVRNLVLVRVPPAEQVVRLARGEPLSQAPRYIAAVEGTRGGPTLRPFFLGRTDPLRDDRYGDLLVLGGVLQASPGSLLFGLDGSFVGLCIMEDGFVAGIPGRALETAVAAMLAPQGR